MEKSWKFVCLCLVVLFLKLCNGLPILLESTIPAGPSVELFSEVIVVLLTVCTVLLLVGCLCCHRPSGFNESRLSTVSSVDNGLVNPSAEAAFTIFAPLGHNFSPSNDKFSLEDEYSYGDINVSSWFNEGAFDFPRTKLKYIRELGKGWFGSVVEGTAQDPEENTWTPVVVRILDSSASNKEKVFFLHEAEIYKCGSHTNLLKLHGRCLNSDPFLLLQELCPQGDLKAYLLSNKRNDNLLSSEYPLVWCCQITSALKFLHEKGLAHSDLACRNCQLTSNLTVKLGDYGLSPSRYPEDYYEGVPTVSVRWCAPESIRHTSTTIQPERITREANVWSLAVCFWEICECGARPYADLTDDEVVTQVLGKAHVRLPRPRHIVLYTDYIYGLMQSCWLTPESRPTSTQIYLTLTDLLQVFTVCKSESKDASVLQESQESFDLRWNSLKPNNSGISEVSSQKSEVKPMSPSLNNLIGSLEDMNRSRTSEEDNARSVLLPGGTIHKFEFELSTQSKEPLETDSLDDSMVYNMRRSSSSETEEENWKKKIERGAYTEKVRQKSRSVADLMVLTHIDCSESESETPQPSLDHRVNYKNVRLAPRHNLESASYVHGSEGNLLSVQDDFQAELKKLQEEHRDSLFFVPDKYSQTLRNEQVNNNLGIDKNFNPVGESSERLIKELSSTSEITPVNQVYNVFSVTVDNLSPIHVVKLKEIINLEDTALDYIEKKTFASYKVPKLCDIIQNNSMVANMPDIINEAYRSSDQNEDTESARNSAEKEASDFYETQKLDRKYEEEKHSISNDHTFPLLNESLHIATENRINRDLSTEGMFSEKVELDTSDIMEYGHQTRSDVEISEMKQSTEFFEIVNETLKTEKSHFNEKCPCDKDESSSVPNNQELLTKEFKNELENSNFTNTQIDSASEEKNLKVFLTDIKEECKEKCEKNYSENDGLEIWNTNQNEAESLSQMKKRIVSEEREQEIESESGVSSESVKTSSSENGGSLKCAENRTEIKSEFVVPPSELLDRDQNEAETSLSETKDNFESEKKRMVMKSEISGSLELQNKNQNEEEAVTLSLPNIKDNLESVEIRTEKNVSPLGILEKNQNEAETVTLSVSEIKDKFETMERGIETKSVKNSPPSELINKNQHEAETSILSVSEIKDNLQSVEMGTEIKSEKNVPPLAILNKKQNEAETVSLSVSEIKDKFETMEKRIGIESEKNSHPLELLNKNQHEAESFILSVSAIKDNYVEKETEMKSEKNGSPSELLNINQNGADNVTMNLSEIRDIFESTEKLTDMISKENGPTLELIKYQHEAESIEESEIGDSLESNEKETEIKSERIGPLLEISNINQNEAESLKASLLDNLESEEKGEELKSENNGSFSGTLNGHQNTLENLFVFQLGENLDSFEMNSQISDLDFSLRSEISKETLDRINEGSDLESIQTYEKTQQEERYSMRSLFKKKEDNREYKKNNCQFDPATGAKCYQVPKLIDLIENNVTLMDYIIAHYESELHDDLSCENSGGRNTAIVEMKDSKEHYPMITFDLSNSQEAANPNSLTHLNAFSSLKTKPKSSLELITSTPGKMPPHGDSPVERNNLNYSLETWDNFLGDALDTQSKNINDHAVVFESLNSEPQSLLFIETEGVDLTVTPPNSDTEASLDGGFLDDVYNNQTINIEDSDDLNKTYNVDDSDLNKTYEMEGSFSMEEGASDDQDESGTWESSGGWFLHPQSSGSVSGQITEQRDVRLMDDEILAALRGELLAKLPHAQGSTSDKLKENNEEWDPNEKDEVFLRYNVYNTPLSPIPEESENEEYSDYVCTATGSPASEASDDWPEKLLENVAPQENDSQSLKAQGLHQHHTLSQDSCCSNDTLFNLEDMTYVLTDQDDKVDEESEIRVKRLEEERIRKDAIDYFKTGTSVAVPLESPIADLESPMELPPQDKTHLADFLVKEREHSEMVSVVVTETVEENRSDSNSAPLKTAAPLPSPDDHPWKQLSDSLLKKGLLETAADEDDSNDSTTYIAADHGYENIEEAEPVEEDTPLYSMVEECLPEYANTSGCLRETEADHVYENVEDVEKEVYSNVANDSTLPGYVNVFDGFKVDGSPGYENVGTVGDTLNEADYVNITNIENAKISADFDKEGCFDENRVYDHADDELIIRHEDEDQDNQLLGVLTDIRFSGPGESHLMSTSFSESNEIQNEQDWESGSDTRSSSSGEFIWREGEHEESLKALQALPQDLLDDIEPSKEPRQESSGESSCSDEEGECPEFIPSAWDKYATPTKSALRSPEKTLEKEEKKKGVWFKKQRYHCVYEYPKEPDSPVLQSFDLWNNTPPATTYPEWYFDIDHESEFNDFTTATNFSDGDTVSTDFTTTFNNEFFVTGSATPFDMMTTSSQFFPGGDHWSELSKLNENTTPDSGVEDVTPGSMDRVEFSCLTSIVPSLKQLSEAAYAKSKQKETENRTSEILGGLRHTRDKLKLDLPPSPNTFTSNKTFSLEPNVEPVVIRERPAFTTFGKSRFLVQHVDTPDRDTIGKNVCFEALPYKPIEKKEAESKTKKIKKDEEKGEASLLDSADEDSGIESSTLERKSSDAGKLILDL